MEIETTEHKEMTHGVSNGHMTDDITWPWMVIASIWPHMWPIIDRYLWCLSISYLSVLLVCCAWDRFTRKWPEIHTQFWLFVTVNIQRHAHICG